MKKTNKLTNLKRLNFSNICVVILYLLKLILKIKPSQKELEVYVYYNILINANGYFYSETHDYYISNFDDTFHKRIKIRKFPSSDRDVFKQINIFKEYLPVVFVYQENFHNNEQYCMNIIDAGCNIGLTSLFFLEYFKNSSIICLEPEPENFKVLEYNLINSNNSKIVKINGALWSCNTTIKMINDFRHKSDWSFRVEKTDEDTGIQAYSMNHLIKNNNLKIIDILKIDIEGSEVEVFTSTKSNLDFLNITKCISIEIHNEFDCRNAIYEVLKRYGFAFFNQGELTIGINQNLLL